LPTTESAQKGTIVLAFSIWNALWIVFVSFLFIVVLMMMFTAIVDLFRDDELGGFGKALWILLLIFLPLIGLLLYTIVRGKGMAEREMQSQVQARESFDAYVRETAGGGAASELEKATKLHSEGKLTDDEFAALKSKILA
jgi:ABC-type multidrug transport system fused ATPase/permease subunit